ncbi:MAG TPA: hypothetical protein VFI13_05310, partial [Gemmatimonadales bacterium]|nr:hypothetical protein [Gemmatimonadales bacterium]
AALLVILLTPMFRRYHLFSATGSDLPGTGGGGGGAQYIALPALRSFTPKPPAQAEVKVETPPVVTPPVVPPSVIPPPTPVVDTLPHQAPAPAHADSAGGAAGTGPGQGGGSGGGSGGGQGPGTGGGAGPGTGGSERGRPPEQRQMIIPPTEGTPKPLRGKELTVRFFVSSGGTVDRIEIDPDLPAGGFRNMFVDLMQGFKFKPARDSIGVPVAGVATVHITLSNH